MHLRGAELRVRLNTNDDDRRQRLNRAEVLRAIPEGDPDWDVVHRGRPISETRNSQIVADVTASLGCGRNCLVLTRRVAHVEVLTSLLATRGHQALVLQGGMSVTDRRAAVNGLTDAKAGDGVLVIGTTPFIGEGFDAPALDTLFLAAPVSFDGLLVQCAGRIIRAAPGKEVAEVHDYHDRATPILAASLPRRMPGYRTLGFTKA